MELLIRIQKLEAVGKVGCNVDFACIIPEKSHTLGTKSSNIGFNGQRNWTVDMGLYSGQFF
jgi:hypothetical protein